MLSLRTDLPEDRIQVSENDNVYLYFLRILYIRQKRRAILSLCSLFPSPLERGR